MNDNENRIERLGNQNDKDGASDNIRIVGMRIRIMYTIMGSVSC